MSKYMFFLGGTGARCAEAFCHMCMAGMVVDEKTPIYILVGDADDQNKNTGTAQKAFVDYAELHEKLKADNQGMHLAKQEIQYFRWIIGEGLFEPKQAGADRRTNLKVLNRVKNTVQNESEDLMKALYTPSEMENSISSVGFFAHPNVGAAILRASMINDDDHANDDVPFTSEYGKFRTMIINDLVEGNDVQVVLVGSLFGGTGASCVPGIAEDIISKCTDRDDQQRGNLSIGSVMLLPYFCLTANKQGTVDRNAGQSFQLATKTALNYYATQKSLFDCTYLLGLPIWSGIEVTDRGGSKQNNHAMVTEWEAAMACFRYFKTYSEAENQVYYKGCEIWDKKLRLSWKSFSWNAFEVSSITTYLGSLLRFSLFYLYKLLPDIRGMKKGEVTKANFYYKYCVINDAGHNPQEEEYWIVQLEKSVAALEAQCNRYIQWLSESLLDNMVEQSLIKRRF